MSCQHDNLRYYICIINIIQKQPVNDQLSIQGDPQPGNRGTVNIIHFGAI